MTCERDHDMTIDVVNDEVEKIQPLNFSGEHIFFR